jgi:putative restriction endonuclease
MIEEFRNDESGYLTWVHSNPRGFVVNIDDPNLTQNYPMVHAATHKVVSSGTRENYTTGRYFKVCSESLAELETWSVQHYRRPLVRCQQCSPK